MSPSPPISLGSKNSRTTLPSTRRALSDCSTVPANVHPDEKMGRGSLAQGKENCCWRGDERMKGVSLGRSSKGDWTTKSPPGYTTNFCATRASAGGGESQEKFSPRSKGEMSRETRRTEEFLHELVGVCLSGLVGFEPVVLLNAARRQKGQIIFPCFRF